MNIMGTTTETRPDRVSALLERALLRGATRRLTEGFDRRCRRTILLRHLLATVGLLAVVGLAAYSLAAATPRGDTATNMDVAGGVQLTHQILASL